MKIKTNKIIKRPMWTRSKTQIFAVCLIVLGAIQANMGILTPFFTPEAVGYLSTAIGFIVYILRGLTTSSILDKEIEETQEELEELEEERDGE